MRVIKKTVEPLWRHRIKCTLVYKGHWLRDAKCLSKFRPHFIELLAVNMIQVPTLILIDYFPKKRRFWDWSDQLSIQMNPLSNSSYCKQ